MSKSTGAGFAIFALLVIYLAFYGGWGRLVALCDRLVHPEQHVQRVSIPGEGVKGVITDLKKSLPADGSAPGSSMPGETGSPGADQSGK